VEARARVKFNFFCESNFRDKWLGSLFRQRMILEVHRLQLVGMINSKLHPLILQLMRKSFGLPKFDGYASLKEISSIIFVELAKL
jgi:hypothetical protein